MRVRRLPPARRMCRPRVWGPAPCARRPAMAHGDALDQACRPSRWSTRAQGPWPPRVRPDRPSSTSTVVSSWPPTRATPPHGQPPQLLEGDTGQTPVERGCRFLKDPALLASALDRKTPERIMALVMVMTVCWLGYAALEYRIRQHCRGMTRRFPIHKGNVCSIQPPGGCVMILWAFISSWLQDHGPSCCISPMRIATSCHSWGNRLGHCMASTIHENQNGHAECRLRS
jgi:hypothetical protein